MNLKENLILIFTLILGTVTGYSQDSISDYEGNKYTTAVIGNQTWMTQNLKSKRDSKGKIIRRVCYGHFEHNCEEYGALYRWDALKIDSSGSKQQGICPPGWHIPTDMEWAELINYLGGADSAAYKLNRNIGGDFNIQHAGNYHSRLKNFNFQGEIAYYWTATSFSQTAAWMRQIGKNNLNINRSTVPIVYSLSIRCVKD